jgi:hypothetical protein
MAVSPMAGNAYGSTMTTHEIAQKLIAFFAKYSFDDEAASILTAFQVIENFWPEAIDAMVKSVQYANTPPDASRHVAQMKLLADKTATEIKKLRNSLVVSGAKQLGDDLAALAAAFDTEQPAIFADLKERTESFIRDFDHFITNQFPHETFALLVTTHDLVVSFRRFRETGMAILSAAHYDRKPSEGYDELDLEFRSDLTLETFLVKLQLLSDVYSDFCRIAGVTTSDYPLQIGKIERVRFRWCARLQEFSSPMIGRSLGVGID